MKIVYELNEVPKRLFEFYGDLYPDSAFSKLRSRSKLFETHAADIGSLSPWITWPTMHRGVSNVDHGISDLGQDLTEVNKDFPNVFNHLVRHDVKVGVLDHYNPTLCQKPWIISVSTYLIHLLQAASVFQRI